MLTNTEFLRVGKPWPPEDEDLKARLARYQMNLDLYNGKQAEVYRKLFDKIQRHILNFKDIIDYTVILNYQKLVSLKTADLLFNEVPDIIIDGGDEELLTDILNNGGSDKDFFDIMDMGAIDTSRLGDGVYYTYKENANTEEIDPVVQKAEDKVKVAIVQPSTWIPIVDPNDLHEIRYHVIATIACLNPQEKKVSNQIYNLTVQIHDIGKYQQIVYRLSRKNGRYKLAAVISDVTYKTGLSVMAITTTSNQLTSDRTTGNDDYGDINSIINNIMIRLSQVAKILDRHAAPSMQGPASALRKNPDTDEYELVAGNYFKKDSKDDADVQYVTWDGKLEYAFKEIETLINQLYVISEMSPALFGVFEKTGAAMSGTALRLRLISPLSKVKRVKKSFDKAIKRIIFAQSELYGKPVKKTSITVNWKDGIPNDPKEEAEIIQMRTGNKQTMSQQRAMGTYDELDDKSVEKEMELIEQNQMMTDVMPTFNTKKNVVVEDVTIEEEGETT